MSIFRLDPEVAPFFRVLRELDEASVSIGAIHAEGGMDRVQAQSRERTDHGADDDVRRKMHAEIVSRKRDDTRPDREKRRNDGA